MLVPFLCVVSAASPLVSKPLSLALPGLNGVNLAPGEMQLHAETISQKLIAHGTSVMTARDLETALGIERQRQLLGCSEDNQCLVELTGALGVEGVVIGDLGRLDGAYVLNLKVLSPTTGKPLAIHNARCKPAELDHMFENAVRALLRGLAQSMHREDLAAAELSPLPDPAEKAAPDARPWALIPAAIGVAALGTGAVLQGMAGQKYGTLSGGPSSEPVARALRDDGRGLETAGNAALIVGGVGVAAAAVIFFVGAPVAPTVSVGPHDSVSVGVAGVLP